MISRLYDPDEGEIFIDGIPVKDIAFNDLRRNVAMVSQETYIFMGSVYSNIAYANPDATKEEVVQAAVLASAHDFICKMPVMTLSSELPAGSCPAVSAREFPSPGRFWPIPGS